MADKPAPTAPPDEAAKQGQHPAILAVTAKTWPPQLLGTLKAGFRVHELPLAAMADARKHLGDDPSRIRAIVTQTAAGAPAALIEMLPALEAVFVSGAHVDKVDLAACRARAIPVTHTPGLSVNDVADFVMTQMMALSRRLAEADRFVRSRQWPEGILPLSHRFTGRTIGIVGLGRIGRAVAHRLQGFDTAICYYGPRHKPDVPYRYYDNLIAMARDVDILAVTCTSSAATRNSIGWPVFEALGETGFFVNVTRGVVNEPELIRALETNAIGGAALDVFETSPHVPEELIGRANVVLSPHVAGFTHELTQAHTDLVLANMHAHFSGQPLLTPVSGDGH